MTIKKNLLLISCLFFSSSVFAYQIAIEKDSSLPILKLSLAFPGGSQLDHPDTQGLHGLTLHSLLRGTRSLSRSELDERLDQLGAKITIDIKTEVTTLDVIVLSKNLNPLLDLVHSLIFEPRFDPTEIELIRADALAALQEQKNSDAALAKVFFDRIFFGSHPYGRQNLGTTSSLKKITREQFIRWHQQWTLHHLNPFILATGDIDQKTLESWAKKTFRQSNPPQLLPLAPTHTGSFGGKWLIVDKPQRTQSQIIIGYPGISIHSPDRDALKIANAVFGEGFNSRLMQELRVKRGWTYGAGSAFKFGSQAHSWRMTFFPKTGDTLPAIQESLRMVDQFVQNGITPKEFEYAKNSLIRSAPFGFNSPEKRLDNLLLETLYQLPQGTMIQEADRMKAIRIEDVNLAIKRWLNPEKRTVVIVATASDLKESLSKTFKIYPENLQVTSFLEE